MQTPYNGAVNLSSAIIILSSLEPFPPRAACCNWLLVSGTLPVAPSRCPGRRECPPADRCLPAHCPARREERRGEERGGRERGRERGEGERGGREGGRKGREREGRRQGRRGMVGERSYSLNRLRHKRSACRLLSCYRSADTTTSYLPVSASL